MPIEIWKDTAAAMSAVAKLMKGELSFDYAGWRIEGEPSDKAHLGIILGLAAVWPYQPQPYPSTFLATWAAVSEAKRHHYELFSFSDDPAVIASLRQTVLSAQLRPELTQRNEPFDKMWTQMSAGDRLEIIIATEYQAYNDHLPLAFLLFSAITDTNRIYTQLWHPCTLPPSVGLELVTYLYRQQQAHSH